MTLKSHHHHLHLIFVIIWSIKMVVPWFLSIQSPRFVIHLSKGYKWYLWIGFQWIVTDISFNSWLLDCVRMVQLYGVNVVKVLPVRMWQSSFFCVYNVGVVLFLWCIGSPVTTSNGPQQDHEASDVTGYARYRTEWLVCLLCDDMWCLFLNCLPACLSVVKSQTEW